MSHNAQVTKPEEYTRRRVRRHASTRARHRKHLLAFGGAGQEGITLRKARVGGGIPATPLAEQRRR